MDRRLLLEFLPGIAFLLGNMFGDLFIAAGAAVVVTAIAVVLRWHMDRRIPWLAVSILVLVCILTGFGILLKDETFIFLRPTVGALAFALILAVGALARPSLLERTLGYKLRIDAKGWSMLHIAWVALAILSAFANEIAWRNLSMDEWAFFNAASDPVLIALIWLATRQIAHKYWIPEGRQTA